MLTAKEKGLLEAMEPLAASNGIEIVTVEVIGSRKAPIIRVYIDAEGGISFQELSSAQEWIGELLDRIDPFPGAYTLEVSSPGIDRPLRTPEHFSRFVGEDVNIRTSGPVDGRNSFKGTLAGFEGGEVLIDMEGGIRAHVPLESVKRANVVGKIEF